MAMAMVTTMETTTEMDFIPDLILEEVNKLVTDLGADTTTIMDTTWMQKQL